MDDLLEILNHQAGDFCTGGVQRVTALVVILILGSQFEVGVDVVEWNILRE